MRNAGLPYLGGQLRIGNMFEIPCQDKVYRPIGSKALPSPSPAMRERKLSSVGFMQPIVVNGAQTRHRRAGRQ
jgi:hypothetical protein